MSNSSKPPSDPQIRALKEKTGLSNGIIKEIYPFYDDIFSDAGILKLKMNRTMAGEKSAFHHVISLLIPWMKKIPSEWNKRSEAQRYTGDLDKTVDIIWIDLTKKFRNESIDFLQDILRAIYKDKMGNSDAIHWSGKILSEILHSLPTEEGEWQEILLQDELKAAGVTGVTDEPDGNSDQSSSLSNTDLFNEELDRRMEDTRKLQQDLKSNVTVKQRYDPREIRLNYLEEEILAPKIDQLRNELLIPEKTIREIIVHLSSGRHVLLAGAIGTGKSALAKRLGGFWAESEPHDDSAGGYDCQEFSANNDWSTQDVIGGIVPVLKSDDQEEGNGSVGYRYHEGCFLKTLKKNLGVDDINGKQTWINWSKEGYLGTWLVIDELNRADIDKAFGPLLSALESGTLSVPDHPDEIYKEIPIPGYFRIIATLNTSDRHYLYKLSDALKRRFAYVEIKSPEDDLREEEIASAYNSARLASGLAEATDKHVPFSDIDDKLKLSLVNAYKFLVSIRCVKDLGTAVLKSIYQTILTGTERGGLDENSALDAALTSNLIPQMDSLSEESLEMLSILYFEGESVKSLDGIRGDITKRERFQKESNMLMRSMYVWNFDEKGMRQPLYGAEQRLGSVFGNKVPDDVWDQIKEEFQKLQGDEAWTLPNFQAALKDLKNQASM